MSDYYIGLLSGTSVDGVDCALIDFSHNPMIVATHHHPYPTELITEIHQLSTPGPDEIQRLGKADHQIGQVFANGCQQLLQKAGIKANEIIAIGSHGQNIRHQPYLDHPFTIQIGDPNIIASKTGIPTVADFRRKDLALGGQGAPLVPLLHQVLFQSEEQDRVIVNIGGIANITFLPANKKILLGFDTGPGNTLLDLNTRKNLNKEFDANGEWGAKGKCNDILLNKLLTDPYFKKSPPKSTGREHFNWTWLEKNMTEEISPVDLQATLTELTASSIAQAIKQLPANNPAIYVCGGGTHNTFLMERFISHCQPCSVKSTTELAIDPDWIEALLFAWLAKQTMQKLPGNAPSVTGASRASVLGGIYYP